MPFKKANVKEEIAERCSKDKEFKEAYEREQIRALFTDDILDIKTMKKIEKLFRDTNLMQQVLKRYSGVKLSKNDITESNKSCERVLKGETHMEDKDEGIEIRVLSREDAILPTESLKENIFNHIDEALKRLAISDSSVQYAPHIREEFNNVVDELNAIKSRIGYKDTEHTSHYYFEEEVY